MSNSTVRVISGAVLIIVLALLAWAGGLLLLTGVAIISIAGLKEYLNVTGTKNSKLSIACLILILFYLPALYFMKEKASLLFLIMTFLTLAVVSVYNYPQIPVKEFALILTGMVYVPFSAGFLYLCRDMDAGLYLFILIFMSSWLGDTFGYEFGRRFGKHKMAPVLSPKKSKEGLAAELIGVTVCCTVYGLIFKNALSTYSVPVVCCVLCGLCGSILSVFGDLFASSIKREYGIKDYGKLIPGHGGILDRFDSTLFTALFVYFIFNTLGKL